MKLHSYIIDHDFGFAPNPFFGVCTLANCKPKIRRHAAVGDYIIGTGCARRSRAGYLVYFMRITGVTDFESYWNDPNYQRKKPSYSRGRLHAFGDNIYHKDSHGEWVQSDSFHSLPNGVVNADNLRTDTSSTSTVLLSNDFCYWGGSGPRIPNRFRNCRGQDICCTTQGHKNKFDPALVADFVDWLRSHEVHGLVGKPLEWGN